MEMVPVCVIWHFVTALITVNAAEWWEIGNLRDVKDRPCLIQVHVLPE